MTWKGSSKKFPSVWELLDLVEYTTVDPSYRLSTETLGDFTSLLPTFLVGVPGTVERSQGPRPIWSHETVGTSVNKVLDFYYN